MFLAILSALMSVQRIAWTAMLSAKRAATDVMLNAVSQHLIPITDARRGR